LAGIVGIEVQNSCCGHLLYIC